MFISTDLPTIAVIFGDDSAVVVETGQTNRRPAILPSLRRENFDAVDPIGISPAAMSLRDSTACNLFDSAEGVPVLRFDTHCCCSFPRQLLYWIAPSVVPRDFDGGSAADRSFLGDGQ